jgi:hypothetical protein
MNVTKKRMNYTRQARQVIMMITSPFILIAAIVARFAMSTRRAVPSPVMQQPRTTHAVARKWRSTDGIREMAPMRHAARSQGTADATATLALDNQPPNSGYTPPIHRPSPHIILGLRNGYTAPQRTRNYGPSKRTAKPPKLYRALLIDRGSYRPRPWICAWLH